MVSQVNSDVEWNLLKVKGQEALKLSLQAPKRCVMGGVIERARVLVNTGDSGTGCPLSLSGGIALAPESGHQPLQGTPLLQRAACPRSGSFPQGRCHFRPELELTTSIPRGETLRTVSAVEGVTQKWGQHGEPVTRGSLELQSSHGAGPGCCRVCTAAAPFLLPNPSSFPSLCGCQSQSPF